MRPRLSPTHVTVHDITRLVGGVLVGPGTATVSTICPIDAPRPHGLSFTRLKSWLQVERLLDQSPLAALIVPKDLEIETTSPPIPLIGVDDPVYAISQVIPHFFEPAESPVGISPRADVDPTAVVGRNVQIGAFAVIGPRVILEDDVVIHPHVVLYPGVRIGPRTIVHAGAIVREECVLGADSVVQNGAVIGADGFGYTPRPGVGLVPVPQVGIVVLGDRVDVGANSCVDRATLGATRVGLGTKIDNLVQIGHNTTIGQHAVVCGQVGIAGSCAIGDQVVLGGGVGVGDHVTIVAGARFAGRSGVSRNITAKGDYAGHPATPLRRWNRAITALLRGADPKGKPQA